MLSQSLTGLQKAFDRFADIDKRMSIVEERQANNARLTTMALHQVDEMRHGNGFVRGHRNHLDGEYPLPPTDDSCV